MTFISTFLFYTFFASVILFIGIGTNKVIDLNLDKLKSFTYCSKIILSILFSSLTGWFVTKGILVPLKIAELFPLVCFLIYVCIDSFFEALIRLTTGKSAAEFIFSYLVILLSITESSSVLFTLFISICSLLSMLIIIPFSLTFRRRVCSNGRLLDEKYYSLYFIFLAVLILLLSVWDIVWLNPGVIK